MKTPAAITARIGAVAVFVLTLAGGPLSAGAADMYPPKFMSYQSYLSDANNIPLGNTGPQNYDVVFRMYNVETGGSAIWAEQQTLTVDKGYFSVLLGEGSEVAGEPGLHASIDTLFTGADISDRYIQMTVRRIGAGGTDVDISPRLRLVTSPFAFTARNAVYAANLVNGSNGVILTVSANCIGINKQLPNAALDVVGNAAVSGNATITGAVTAASLMCHQATVSGTLTAGTASVTGTLSVNTLNASNVTVATAVSANSFEGFGIVPLGGIIMWSGAINAIPHGWALCNGQATNGWTTPNLRDRFVLGAGSTYNVGAMGGLTNITLTANNLPTHDHVFRDGFTMQDDPNGDAPPVGGSIDTGGYYNGTEGNDGDNRYMWFQTNTTYAAGSSQSFSILPPYYALAYIMRVQ